MIDLSHYKEVNKDGITAAVVNDGKVLLLKRIWLPFMSFPGIWTFITGGRKEGEEYLDAAYREIEEETKIERKHLKLIARIDNVMLYDPVWKRKKWRNAFFVFSSSKTEVKLDMENRNYRWASMDEIANGKNYTNIFADRVLIEKKIKDVL